MPPTCSSAWATSIAPTRPVRWPAWEPARPRRCNTAVVDDFELLERARAGDSSAFGVLAERYQSAAFHLAYVIARDSAEAEDVTQDAFLKAYVALPRFKSEAPFRPWLLQIVANEARNRRRSAGRRAHLAAQFAAAEGMHDPVAASPEVVPLAVPATLGLGAPVTREVAAERLGRPLPIVRALGEPDAIYAQSGEVWLAYAPRDGLPPAPQSPGLALLLTEFARTGFDPVFL